MSQVHSGLPWRAEILRHEHAPESSGRLDKTQQAGLTPEVSDLVGLG